METDIGVTGHKLKWKSKVRKLEVAKVTNLLWIRKDWKRCQCWLRSSPGRITILPPKKTECTTEIKEENHRLLSFSVRFFFFLKM